jgi:hypothetical protein
MEPKSLVYVLDAAIGDALDGLRDLVLDGRTSRSYVAADDPVSGRRTEAGS